MFDILGLHGSSQHPHFISDFTGQLSPDRRRCSPQGTFADGDGFTFFKRRPDFSIPADDLVAVARRSLSADGIITACGLSYSLLVGYSSGAIFSTALLAVAPEKFIGAILLRPQPIADTFAFPDLSGKPVLIISGRHDARREPEHADILVEQLVAANAAVTHHALDAGHGWAPDDADLALARAWIAANFP
ncbi:MAG: alpha/beta hydrolase [Allorhizobium sp.]